MKNAVITVIVAGTVAFFGPRDLRDVATFTIRAGIALVQLGLALYPSGYDAGPITDDEAEDDPRQDAYFKAAVLLAEYYPDTPMPNRPGCVTTHCEDQWFGNLRRRRCFWRCRRPRSPAPDPPSFHVSPPLRRYVPPAKPSAPPPRFQAPEVHEPVIEASLSNDSDSVEPIILIVLIAIAAAVVLAIIGHFENISYARSTEDVIDSAAEAEAARANLDAAAREADEIIERYRAAVRQKGREDAG